MPGLKNQRSAVSAESIPLSRPYIDEREEELVLDVLRSGRLSLGPAIDRFEELFAERIGAPYAAAVTSGTAISAGGIWPPTKLARFLGPRSNWNTGSTEVRRVSELLMSRKFG